MHTLSLDAISGLLQTEIVKLINQVNVLNFRGSCLFVFSGQYELMNVVWNQCTLRRRNSMQPKHISLISRFLLKELLKRFIQFFLMISCIEAKGSKQFFVPSCGTYTKIKGYYMQSDWIKLGGVSGPTATSYECMLCFQSLKVELFFSNTSLICIKEPFSSIYPILFKVCVLCLNVCHSQKGL